jgi:hypothetical protein
MKYTNKLAVAFILLLTLLLVVGCSSSGSQSQTETEHQEAEEEHEEAEEHVEGDEHEEDEEHDDSEPHDRIPNENGAAVHLIAPADGEVFQHGDQIIVEVETENFDLSQEGYHWHVYVDGESWGMVMGGNTDQPLTGLEPGEHEISAYLSIASHEEYEDGDSIHITVEE